MTKAEQLYCGVQGAAYWERNRARLQEERYHRASSIRHLAPAEFQDAGDVMIKFVEVGCGRGHNLYDHDVGIDIDARNLSRENRNCSFVGIVAPAYYIPLPDKSYPVVFSVGCLMHLPSTTGVLNITRNAWGEISMQDDTASWQGAVREMARISTKYVIIGEYWEDEEVEVDWHGEKGVLWARNYTVPGFTLTAPLKTLPAFGKGVNFGIFIANK